MYEGNNIIIYDCGIKINGCILKCSNEIIMRCNEEICKQLSLNVLIYIYDSIKGKVTYSARIKNILDNIIILSDLIFIDSDQRRKDIRIIVNIPIKINQVFNIHNELINLNKYILMNIKNYSKGGLLLSSALDISDNFKLQIVVDIHSNHINQTIKILRKYKIENIYYYGCKFIN